MKAIAIDYSGAPPSLHDLPVPHPGVSEVPVRVRASSVNGLDVAVAGGYAREMTGHHFPSCSGGTSLAPSRRQARACGRCGRGTPSSAWSRRSARRRRVRRVRHGIGDPCRPDPRRAGTRHCRGAGLAGTVALAAIDAVAPLPGQAVLISGATGGIGSPVQRTYSLADVPQALADFAASARGKLAVSVA